MIALGVAWLFLWRRRKRANKAEVAEPSSDEIPEAAGQGIAETSGKERYEIQDKDTPTEVMGDMYRAELSATTERDRN